MSWDLSELKKNVQKSYGSEQSSKLTPCLNSIVERQEFSRYHYHQAKDTFEKALHDKTDSESLIDLVLMKNSKEGEEFEESKFITRANILSCIQNIHSVSDILSHVIYYSLDLKNAKNEYQISLSNVFKWIEQEEQYKSLAGFIESLIEHKDYKYLSAIVNHSKHRSIVEAYFNVNLRKQGKDMQEIKFREFVFRKKSYSSRHAFEFLTKEFDRESELVVKIGNKLNEMALKNANKALKRN